MKLLLNGKPHETGTATLAEMLAELQLDEAAVATALNGEFVARAARPQTPLQAGDAVEVLSPMQGG
jgi:sulfur carrier protein